MAFHFPLETLLKHRKRQMEMAQREFEIAQHQLNQCLQEIDNIHRQILESRQLIAYAESQKTTDTRSVDQLFEFIEGSKIRMKIKQNEARNLMEVADNKRRVFQEKATDHKSLERLKDRRKSEYKVQVKKKENQTMDDMNVMRGKRGVSV
ncbi:MAG: flagellar export protein FliJ [Pseudobdellovibrionaceae bacterium]|nr:flagellar export protein FliJ [Bdellovibrionales bacterium]USN47288.1 MAG: flagellar export protein FliJ [Pseudobdellovibrionaceae bacterium]